MLSTLKKHYKEWVRNESGVTAIEYGLLTAGIGFTIIIFVFTFGADMTGLFESFSEAVSSS